MKDRFLRVLRGEKVDRTPIWMMRQAGRYLPEYRATRAQAGSFLDLCKNPELACEVTLQPLRRYQFDAAILFSDILTIPDAMGLGLYFSTGEGPKFKYPLHNKSAIENLAKLDVEALQYVFDAVKLIKQNIDIPLIGFSGSPWTLAAYMVEGSGSKDFNRLKALIYGEPQLAHQLLNQLSDAVSAYLTQQIKSGADAIMIFDTWGGLLPAHSYQEFSLNYMKKIIEALQTYGKPVILFSKGAGLQLEVMSNTGAAGLGVDWTCDLQTARKLTQDKVALQGNMDPAVLCSNPQAVRQEVQRVLAEFGHGGRHIFNLGHGITPEALPENVAAMVEAVQEFSPQYH